MDVVAQHTCKGSRWDASPGNTPTDNAAEGILLDCCRDAWGHGMPPNDQASAAHRNDNIKGTGCVASIAC